MVKQDLPEDAEAGGGLMVATIQLAITLGAGVGGALFDAVVWWSPFAFSAVLLTSSSILACGTWRVSLRSATLVRDLAIADQRGRLVGTVASGLFTGILLAHALDGAQSIPLPPS